MAAGTTLRGHRILAMAFIVPVIVIVAGVAGTAARVEVRGGTPDQMRTVEWAIDRFRVAGLTLPQLDVTYHGDPAGCAGNSGLYAVGHLDVCTGGKASSYARKTIVHELAHAWIDANVSAAGRSEFMRSRGLESWNDGGTPWGLRGSEQAAEVITWFVGPGLTPMLPDHPDPAQLAVPYQVLTGTAPPHLH